MAVFFVVALMTVIPGTMLHMMQSGRETQRYIDRVPLLFTADALQERAIHLVSDYAITNGEFPSTTQLSSLSDSVVSWYQNTGGFKDRNKANASILGTIVVTSVIFTAVDDGGNTSSRQRYKAAVDVKETATGSTIHLEQEFVINNARLFDFSAFYNEELEIGAGPSFTLQGPIFSNKNIYLMNDVSSTLSLTRPDDWGTSNNPEKYVLKSAGNIYFYFNRALGKNYLADPATPASSIYLNGISQEARDYYNGGFNDGNNLELLRFRSAYWNSSNVLIDNQYQLPKFNFFTNGAQWGNSGSDNKIRIQDQSGIFINLTHPGLSDPVSANMARAVFLGWDGNGGAPNTSSRRLYARKTFYESFSDMSLSSGIDPNSPPQLIETPSAPWDPKNPLSETPLVNPNWPPSALQTVSELVLQKSISIGDPNHPHGAHVLIEPLTDIFPQGHSGSAFAAGDTCPLSYNNGNCADKAAVKGLKLQTKANLNLYIRTAEAGQTFEISPDLLELADASNQVVVGVDTSSSFPLSNNSNLLQDFRLNLTPTARALTIDIAKLIEKLPTLKEGALDGKGVVIYIHTYPMRSYASSSQIPRFVKLINGSTLPKEGLTIASNGRVFIRGNYNTTTYSYPDPANPVFSINKVPPAAIISDSVVVLSNEWESHNADANLSNRAAASDVTVNAGFAVGFLGSQLTEMYPYCKTTDPSTGIESINCVFDPANSFSRPPKGGSFGYGYAGFTCDTTDGVTSTNCELPAVLPSGVTLPIYGDCRGGVGDRTCLYKQDPDTKFYYINQNSDIIRTLLAIYGAGALPSVPIPIFVDYRSAENWGGDVTKLEPIRVFPGVSSNHVRSYELFRWGGTSCPTECIGGLVTTCTPPTGERVDPVCSTSCPGGYQQIAEPPCVPQPGKLMGLPPYIRVSSGNYLPLYDTRYSGGLENLINLQESWTGRTLNILGTFSAPWKAKELEVNGTPKYWSDVYYHAPQRNFDFNEDLRIHPPPGSPFYFFRRT